MVVTLVYLLVMLMLPASLGVYVYRDAKKRGMNPVLWTLIAMLAPSLIGFIIYLLVRGNYSNMMCPNCNTRIAEQYVVCPGCGAKLKPTCPNCMTAVEPDWNVCPKCAHALPEYQDDVVTPVKPKDKALWKILVLVILVPILFIIVLIGGFVVMRGSGSVGMEQIWMEEYADSMDEPQIEAWLKECDNDPEKAYVLTYKTEDGDEKEVQYLVYVPAMEDAFDYRPVLSSGLFGNKLKIEIENVNGTCGDVGMIISCTGEKYTNLKSIELDGVKLDCEVTEVDFEILSPNYENEIEE